jgi:hypothetical protein
MPPVVPFTRALYPPSHAKGPVADGVDVVALKRAFSRAGYFPWRDYDDSYSEAFAQEAVVPFQAANGIQSTGNYGQATHEELRNTRRKGHPQEWAFDAVSIRLMQDAAGAPPPRILPALGPVTPGDKPVTDHDCTHATSGINLYPAFDTAFGEGVPVIAPEPLVITRGSSSRPGDACYADGVSGLRYWFGHLDLAPEPGERFGKGAQLAVTCHNTVGGGPHLHLGVNTELIWGAGRQLIHKTTYVHGAPLIGVQLAAFAGRLL